MPIQFAPTLSYPKNLEQGFPVGQSFFLIFSNVVDLERFKESCVLFGRDFDRTSGPDNALWLNSSDATTPFFLRSPGFGGFIDYDIEEILIDSLETMTVSDKQILEDKVSGQNTLIKLTPKIVLPEDNTFYLYIIGDNADESADLPAFVSNYSENKSVSIKTVYGALEEDQTVSERVKSKGSYFAVNNETSSKLFIKIVKDGEGSEAKYIWWFNDENEPQPASNNYNTRLSRCVQRWRTLDRGVLVRFSGSQYNLDETFTINCYVRENLENSYLITFYTSTDSVYEYPENSSTSPLGNDLGLIPGVGQTGVSGESLIVTSIEPYDGAINVDLNLKKIIISFNKDLNPETITQESIKLFSYPVSGSFNGPNGTRSDREFEILKIVSVEGNKIIAEL
jgi:hypothetical protein